MSYQKVVAAKKKLADVRARKPVQQLGFGGISLPNPTQVFGNGPDWSGQTGGAQGTFGGGYGPFQARQNISDYLSDRDPGRAIGNALNPHINSLPDLAHVPGGVVNPFDQTNPTVQAMQQQGVHFQAPNARNQNLEQSFAKTLGQEAMGNGPAQQLANLQTRQNMNNSAQQAASQLAGTHGLNPAIASRLIAQQQANANQNASMQGAQLGLQGQLGAQQQYGNILGDLRSRQLEQSALQAQTALQNQGQQFGAIGNLNQITNQGSLGAQGIDAEILKAQLGAKAGMFGGLLGAGGGILSSVLGGGGGGAAAGSAAGGYAGGDAGEVAGAAASTAAHGALIPGKASYPGDDQRNDKVPTDLSPGEIVIPRSITQHPHAPWLAAAFVQQALAGRGPKPQYRKMADGGEVDDDGGAAPLDINDFIVRANQNKQAEDRTAQQDQSANAAEEGVSNNIQIEQQQKLLQKKINDDIADGATPEQIKRRYAGDFDDLNSLSQKAAHVQELATPAPAPVMDNPNVPRGTSQPDMAPAGPTAPNPFAGTMDLYNQSFDKERAAANAAAGASSQEAQGIAAANAEYVRGIQQANVKREATQAQLDGEGKQLTQDIMNQNIDPNRVWNNASTGNKVLASIGILLSGIGSGLTGQPNLAMNVINKMIDNDIDAQKAELGKKHTLLSANLQKYGRMDAAYAATAHQLGSVLQGQIGLAAAKSGDAKAQANAQMISAQIDQQQAGLQQKVGQMQFAQAMGAGAFAGGAGNTPRVNLEALPEDLRKRAVRLPNGGVALSRDEKTATEAQQSIGHLQNLESQINDAIGFIDKVGTTVPGSVNNAKAESMRDSLTMEITKLHDLNRMNENEFELAKGMVGDPGAVMSQRSKAKLEQLKRLIGHKRDAEFSTLEGVGSQAQPSPINSAPVYGGSR